MGRPVPEEFIAPELRWDLALYWEAYIDLMSCRPAGWACIMPIPWHVVQHYAEVSRFDEDQTSNLHYFTRRMDEALIKREKAKGGDQ